MPIILRNTPIGRRAALIHESDLELLLETGRAIQCEGYDLYEEVTDGELAQGYMTRNMTALPTPGKRRGRPPKAKQEPVMADEEILETSEGEAAEAAEEVVEATEGEAEASAEAAAE